MKSNDDPSGASDETDVTASDRAARARQLEETLKLSPETARLSALDESASGPGKPASREVDSARAAEARATETD